MIDVRSCLMPGTLYRVFGEKGRELKVYTISITRSPRLFLITDQGGPFPDEAR